MATLTNSLREDEDGHGTGRPVGWVPVYWLYALAPPLFLAAFDSLNILAFETKQAPNVSVTTQVIIIIFLYLFLLVMPRLAWFLNGRYLTFGRTNWRQLIVAHGAGAFILASFHILLITTALVIMYTPPGWGWRFLGSYSEEWLKHFGLWVIVYAMTAGLLLYFQSRRFRNQRSRQPPKPLQLRHRGKLIFVDTATIRWVEAAGNYIEIHADGGTYTTRQTLAAFAAKTSRAEFIRVHRRALVNISHIQAVKTGEGDAYLIELTGGLEAPLSRRHLRTLKNALKVIQPLPPVNI